MCGIYGVFLQQKTNAAEKVFAGIKRIEYRGYDSWGVAALDKNGEIQIEKHVGKISGVEKVNLPAASVAIGHTRWATHGGVTDLNAHPHLAQNGSFVLVQNGVVENFQELKLDLEKSGYQFLSQTDTEVIVGLLERAQTKQQAQDLTSDIFATVMEKLEGRSTVVAMTSSGNIFAFRNGSPLVVGRDTAKNIYFSSDVLSLCSDATEYFLVENRQQIDVMQGKLSQSEITFQPLDLESVQLDKAGFDHFMLKEIHEQAEVLVNVLRGQETMLQQLALRIKQSDLVYVLGAGSASYVGEYIAYQLRLQGIKAYAVKSYEAASYIDLVSPTSVCVAISQSGETADTNEGVEQLQAQGATIASIVNMPGSTLTQLSDFACMLSVGPEVGVASTKAMVGQMMWGWVVSQLVAGVKLATLETQILEYQDQLKTWLNSTELTQQIQSLVQVIHHQPNCFILGRGQLFASALECSLKIKEISYVHAEGFSGGELKHGVIALVEQGTPIIGLIAEDEEKANMLSALAEVKARGADTVGIASEQNDLFDHWISIPSDKQFVAMSTIIVSQLVTYYLALEKGLDPDKPRNLAKSVTVK